MVGSEDQRTLYACKGPGNATQSAHSNIKPMSIDERIGGMLSSEFVVFMHEKGSADITVAQVAVAVTCQLCSQMDSSDNFGDGASIYFDLISSTERSVGFSSSMILQSV
jgi:hypothetical protein